MWTRSGEGPGGKARSKGRRKTLKVVLALTGTPTTPHWYTHRTTLVHPPHHTGTPTAPHWYTHHTTLVHPPHHTGTPTAPHWYTHRTTLVHPPHHTGTPTAPHWYTHRTTLVHPPHHTGTPTAPHWYTHRTTLVHPPHHTGTPTAPHWYTHRAVNGVDQHGTICTAVEVGSDGTISLMASRITLGGEGRGVCTWGVGWGCMCVPTTVNLTAEPFTVTILVFCCMIK